MYPELHIQIWMKEERRIDEYPDVDGSRDLSDPWTGFTQFTLFEEKPPNGYMWSGERLTRKQLTSRPDHLWPELWEEMGKKCQAEGEAEWSHEEPQLDNARKLRGMVNPMRPNQNWRVFWKLVNLQDCVWKNLYRIIMKTTL